METSGQPKYDSTSMGGGKMKQLKITKRQAALMLLELCHGFLILFAIYACAVVISGHGSEPFVLVGCLQRRKQLISGSSESLRCF